MHYQNTEERNRTHDGNIPCVCVHNVKLQDNIHPAVATAHNHGAKIVA